MDISNDLRFIVQLGPVHAGDLHIELTAVSPVDRTNPPKRTKQNASMEHIKRPLHAQVHLMS
jgi:hypothetical protein